MESEALEREAGASNDGSAKRRQITDGARSVFLTAGFDGASMNDIARAAGVSKGTLYAYFNSKDELFEAIIRGEFAQSAERLCVFRREGDARDMLMDFGVRLISRMSEPGTRALARVVLAATEKFPHVGRVRSMARPDSRRNSRTSKSRARLRFPTRSGRPGSSSICARATSTSAFCSASSTRSAARTSKPRSRRGSTCS